MLEERIDADLALGRHAELVSELEALVAGAAAPRAAARAADARALPLGSPGRRARRLPRRARDAASTSSASSPGPELKELEAAILRQDESLLLAEDAARRSPRCSSAGSSRSSSSTSSSRWRSRTRSTPRRSDACCGATSRRSPPRSPGTAARSRSTPATRSWPPSGSPSSHEDDALRAARAALDVRAGSPALNERLVAEHGVGLEVRIGLESGEVVATPTATRQRLVTGEAVGIAARLEQAAAAGEIVVGELAARLIDHAARARAARRASRSRASASRCARTGCSSSRRSAPAFERTLDAPLVGRKRELAALRRASERASRRRGVAASTWSSGPPGVGKSRLAAELDGPDEERDALLAGRCLSYGEGITYWPLREVARQAAPGERGARRGRSRRSRPTRRRPRPRSPGSSGGSARRSRASSRSCLVFDDVHWAEPTFLELVEHLAGQGRGADPRRLHRPRGAPRGAAGVPRGPEDAERIVLDALSTDETDALLDRLGGAILESDQRERDRRDGRRQPVLPRAAPRARARGRARRARAAGDGPGAARRAPRPARARRAGGARARARSSGRSSGRRRRRAARARRRADGRRTLRRPVRPRLRAAAGATAFRFRHVLVQEAVYRAAPKRLRAELHERFADRLERAARGLRRARRARRLPPRAGLPPAHGARRVGPADREAGRGRRRRPRRGGNPGLEARRHPRDRQPPRTGDVSAAERAPPPPRAPLRARAALRSSGDPTGATAALEAGDRVDRVDAGDRAHRASCAARARVRAASAGARRHGRRCCWRRRPRPPIRSSRRSHDHRSLGRTRLIAGFVQGGHLGRHRRWQESAEQALVSYRNARLADVDVSRRDRRRPLLRPDARAGRNRRCEELPHRPTRAPLRHGERARLPRRARRPAR